LYHSKIQITHKAANDTIVHNFFQLVNNLTKSTEPLPSVLGGCMCELNLLVFQQAFTCICDLGFWHDETDKALLDCASLPKRATPSGMHFIDNNTSSQQLLSLYDAMPLKWGTILGNYKTFTKLTT
jgi:hypothetical protein